MSSRSYLPVCTMLDFQYNMYTQSTPRDIVTLRSRSTCKRSKQGIGRSTTKSRSLSHPHTHRKVITLVKCADRLEAPVERNCQLS